MALLSPPPTVWTTTGNQWQVNPSVVQSTQNPPASLIGNPGQTYVNTVAQTYWVYTGTQWLQLEAGGAGGVFANLTVTPGPTAITGQFTVVSGANVTSIAGDASNAGVHLGDAGVRTVNVGSATGASQTVISSGTAGVAVGSTGTAILTSSQAATGAAGVVATDPAGGVTLSAANNTQRITLFPTGETHTLTNQPFTLSTGMGQINISSDNANTTVNIGVPSTGIKLITIGNSNAGSTTSILAGTGGFQLTAPAAIGVNLTNGTQNASILVGSGAPTVNPAPKGSLYINTTATTTTTRLYINTDGAGTWTNFTTAA